jgi:hypothetical protein
VQRCGKSLSLREGSRCNAATELGKTSWGSGCRSSGTSPGAQHHGNPIYGIDAPKFSRQNAEDFIIMDCSEWPEERRLYYDRANEGLNFFDTSRLVATRMKVQEFPDRNPSEKPRTARRIKLGRNDLCLCGSGKKYKRCCLGKLAE